MKFIPTTCYEFTACKPNHGGGGSLRVSFIFATREPMEALAMALEQVGVTKRQVEAGLKDPDLRSKLQEKLAQRFRGRFGQIYEFQEIWRCVQLTPIRSVPVTLDFHPNMSAQQVYHRALQQYVQQPVKAVSLRNHRMAIWLGQKLK